MGLPFAIAHYAGMASLDVCLTPATLPASVLSHAISISELTLARDLHGHPHHSRSLVVVMSIGAIRIYWTQRQLLEAFPENIP